MAQDRWITGHEVVEQLGIQPFELAELLQNGLQAYTKTGKRLIAHDSYPLIEFENIRVFLKNKGWPEDRIARQGPAIFNFHRKQGMRCVPDSELKDNSRAPVDSFSLPQDEHKRNRKIAYYLSLLFKLDDVKQFIIPVEKVQQQNEDADAHGKQPSLVKDGQAAEEYLQLSEKTEEQVQEDESQDLNTELIKNYPIFSDWVPQQIHALAEDHTGKTKRNLVVAARRLSGEKSLILASEYSVSEKTIQAWTHKAEEILSKTSASSAKTSASSSHRK